jgi:hypothetical protein
VQGSGTLGALGGRLNSRRQKGTALSTPGNCVSARHLYRTRAKSILLRGTLPTLCGRLLLPLFPRVLISVLAVLRHCDLRCADIVSRGRRVRKSPATNSLRLGTGFGRASLNAINCNSLSWVLPSEQVERVGGNYVR